MKISMEVLISSNKNCIAPMLPQTDEDLCSMFTRAKRNLTSAYSSYGFSKSYSARSKTTSAFLTKVQGTSRHAINDIVQDISWRCIWGETSTRSETGLPMSVTRIGEVSTVTVQTMSRSKQISARNSKLPELPRQIMHVSQPIYARLKFHAIVVILTVRTIVSAKLYELIRAARLELWDR